jgi:hypothetical protein
VKLLPEHFLLGALVLAIVLFIISGVMAVLLR